MDFLYQDSFTPWETPATDDKCINYLRKPQEITLKPQRFNNTVHESPSAHKSFRQTSKQVFVSKQDKNYFIERNKLNSRNKPERNSSKVELKKSHQSLHFSRDSLKRSIHISRQQFQAKEQFSTLSTFAVKRKSLKQKIQKTKKLLEKPQKSRVSEIKQKPRQDKIFQQSLQRLLSLSKSHHNFNTQMQINPSTIDSFFPVKNLIRSHNRGKSSCSDLYSHKEHLKTDSTVEKGIHFLEPKNNISYIKKKGNKKSLYRHSKQEKIMNLPKIQILDWQKPDV